MAVEEEGGRFSETLLPLSHTRHSLPTLHSTHLQCLPLKCRYHLVEVVFIPFEVIRDVPDLVPDLLLLLLVLILLSQLIEREVFAPGPDRSEYLEVLPRQRVKRGVHHDTQRLDPTLTHWLTPHLYRLLRILLRLFLLLLLFPSCHRCLLRLHLFLLFFCQFYLFIHQGFNACAEELTE